MRAAGPIVVIRARRFSVCRRAQGTVPDARPYNPSMDGEKK
jgi:hypothetical protein